MRENNSLRRSLRETHSSAIRMGKPGGRPGGQFLVFFFVLLIVDSFANNGFSQTLETITTTDTSSSTVTGSLPYAVDAINADAGGTATFQFSAGTVITFSTPSTMTLSAATTFTNSGTGSVSIDLAGGSLTAVGNNTLNFLGSSVTWRTSSSTTDVSLLTGTDSISISTLGEAFTATTSAGSGTAYGVNSSAGNVTISDLSGHVSATASGTGGSATAIYGATGVSITDIGSAGAVSAKGTDQALAIFAGADSNISLGSVSGSIGATSTSGAAIAVGATGSGGVTISYVDGTIFATGASAAYAVTTANGNITIDSLGGAITATSSAGDAAAVYSSGTGSIAVSTLSSNVSATGNSAYGVYATDNGVTIGTLSGTVSTVGKTTLSEAIAGNNVAITQLTGLVAASGSATAYGIQANSGSVTVSTLSGSVSATSSSSSAYAVSSGSFYSDTMSGVISATSNGGTDSNAYGVYSSGNASFDTYSGTASATSANGSAYAIYGTNAVYFTDMSGKVNATSNGGTNTAAYGIYSSSGSVNFGTYTGSVSAKSASGSAYAIYGATVVDVPVMAGTITATSNGGEGATAYGIYSTGSVTIGSITGLIAVSGSNTDGSSVAVYGGHVSAGTLTGGTTDSAMVLTGTITAVGGTSVVGIYATDALKLKVAKGAVISSSLSTGSLGTAIEAASSTSSADVEVLSGSTISGDIILQASANTLTLTTSTTTSSAVNNTLAGNITVGAGIFQITAGTWTISGDITAQDMAISAGSVTLSGANTIASLDVSYGTVTFNGVSYGSTTIEKTAVLGAGAGTLGSTVTMVAGCTVAGDVNLNNDTSDILTLTAGTAGGSTSIAGNINGEATVYVNAGTWTVAGCVTGGKVDITGGYMSMGSGTSTADVTVSNGGSLSFNAATTGTVTAGSYGYMSGSGTVGNLVNYGTITPGNSTYGKLNVTDTYYNEAGSTLNIFVNASGSCNSIAAGNVVLNGGTVAVSKSSTGIYNVGTTYTFVTASGSVSGKYDAITDPWAFMAAELIYGTNSVQFELVSAGSYTTEAATANQYAVAEYMDARKTGVTTGDFATVISNLNNLEGDEGRKALDAMSGELHPSLASVELEASEQFIRTIARRLQAQSMAILDEDQTASNRRGDITYVSKRDVEPAYGSGWVTWAQGYGVGASMASDGNYSGLSYSIGGLAVGAERQFGETRLGIVGGYSDVNVTLANRDDTSVINGGQFAVYLHRDLEAFYVTGIAAYGYNNYGTTRQIEFGDIDRTARANYSGDSFSFYGEVGKTIFGKSLQLQPFAALEYINVHQNDFTENGADSIDITSGGQDANAFRSMLGARILASAHNTFGQLMTAELHAAWRHEFLDDDHIMDATFIGQTGAFAVSGVKIDPDVAIVGMNATYYISSQFSVSGNYDLLSGDDYTAHAASLGLQYIW